MKSRSTRFVLVGLAASAAGVARAEDPILLATMNAGVTVGTPESFDWHWPALAYLLSPSPTDNVVVFENVVLPPVYPVTIRDSISGLEDPDFDALAALITDGVNQEIVTVAWDEGGGVAGGGGLEASRIHRLVPGFGPDLIGFHIDHIARELTVDIDSPGLDPFGTGIWTDWTVTGHYEIYGWPVPELSSVILLSTAGTCLLLGRIRLRRKSSS